MNDLRGPEYAAWLRLVWGARLPSAVAAAVGERWLARGRRITELFEADDRELRSLDIPPRRIAALRAAPPFDEALLAELRDQRIGLLHRGAIGFPQRPFSAAGYDPPPLFLYRGDLGVLRRPAVAVIGSREPEDRATRWAHKLAAWLAEAKVNVVSGDARGIDRAAEAGAAERQGPVTAVLPLGLLRWEGNDDVELVLSSCYPNSPFSARQALARNGHIAALAWCVVVAESRNVGGTWNGANQALSQGRPVLVRPDEPQTGNTALLHLGARPLSLDPLLAAEQVLRQLESCPGAPVLDDEPTLPGM